MTPGTVLQAALEYAARGWRVIPLHGPTGDPARPCSCNRPGCDKPGKHPRILAWPANASTELTVINRWWMQWPRANVGIACGPGSGLWAMDVDGEPGRAELHRLLSLHEGDLPITPRSLTGGGGEHWLFTHEPGLKNEVRFAPGLDIRTEGGLIVAPPSIHANGALYQWDSHADPSEIPVSPAPRWLVQVIRASASTAAPRAAVTAGGRIPDGQRNATLWSSGCAMRRWGMTETEILAALSIANTSRCDPPLASGQVEDIAHRASLYQPAPEEVTSILGDNRKNGHPKPEGKSREISVYTAADLMRKKLEEPKEIVRGFVYEGFNLFAGKGKTGKSWYVLDLSIAVATGGKALGQVQVQQGDVLYLALEDTERRMQKRLRLRLNGQPPPERLFICHNWPKIGEGCLRALRKWLEDHATTRLVIIDVMKKIKPKSGGNRGVYDDDFEFAGQLKEIADDYSLGLIGVTHTRKAQADDVFDEVNASSGLTGAADAIVVWRRSRGESKARLSITGRDVVEEKAEETAIVLEWSGDLGSWAVLGSAGEIDQSEERQKIIKLLDESPGPVTPSAVANAMEKNSITTRWLLGRMADDGQIARVGYGKYQSLSVLSLSLSLRGEEGKKESWPNSAISANYTNTPNATNSSDNDEDDHTERWQ